MTALLTHFVGETPQQYYSSAATVHVLTSKRRSDRIVSKKTLDTLINLALHNYRLNNNEVLLGSRMPPTLRDWLEQISQAESYPFSFPQDAKAGSKAEVDEEAAALRREQATRAMELKDLTTMNRVYLDLQGHQQRLQSAVVGRKTLEQRRHCLVRLRNQA